MKPIEIAEQYETTHFDGEQSETKDGVGIDRRVEGIKGDERVRLLSNATPERPLIPNDPDSYPVPDSSYPAPTVRA